MSMWASQCTSKYYSKQFFKRPMLFFKKMASKNSMSEYEDVWDDLLGWKLPRVVRVGSEEITDNFEHLVRIGAEKWAVSLVHRMLDPIDLYWQVWWVHNPKRDTYCSGTQCLPWALAWNFRLFSFRLAFWILQVTWLTIPSMFASCSQRRKSNLRRGRF